MKYLLLILLVILFSCGNVTPKHKFAVIYEFESPERLSTNEKQGTIETLNKRLERIASNYEVRFNNKEQIEVTLSTDFGLARINTIITNTGKLDFWEVVKSEDFGPFFLEANALLKKNQDSIEPIFDIINSSTFGYGLFSVSTKDTTMLRRYLNTKEVRQLLPVSLRDTAFLFSIPDLDNSVALYGVKVPADGKSMVNETHITDARQSYNYTNQPSVGMQMNAQGSSRWERMTGMAYQQQSQIAITLNNTVYSAPTVSSGAIKGGNTEIAGNFTIEQAQDLALVLSAHKRIPKLKFVNSSTITD